MHKSHPILRKCMRRFEVEEGCVAVRGVVYDASNFDHPGGRYLLRMYEGMDITPLFETHHLNIRAAEEALLRLDKKGECDPHEADFEEYSKQREKAFRAFPTRQSRRMDARTKLAFAAYLLVAATLHAQLISTTVVCWKWAALCAASAFANAVLGGFGHNWVHTLSAGSVLLDWNGLSAFEWAHEHVHSHHMYVNTQHDHDAISMMPFLNWIPSSSAAWLPWYCKHAVYAVAEAAVALQGNVFHRMRWSPLRDKRAPLWLRLAPFLFLLRIASHAAFQPAHVAAASFFLTLCSSGYYFSYVAHLSHANPNRSDFGKADFLSEQSRHTADIRTEWLSHALLFLDRQTLHHAFPSIDHSRLLRMQREDGRRRGLLELNARSNAALRNFCA